MATIKVNTEKTVRAIKPMHSGGQPPLGGSKFTNHFHYLTEAGIPYSRLHDVGGAFGGSRFVDIPNIFRNFDADENDPANYDFTFTDYLITALIEAGVEPYYRLGITIENQAYVKTYHTDPPKDYEKWARICEHIIMHYNAGWANGFRYNITYWEIWNEPDNIFVTPSELWSGTPEDYYRLYDVAAKHLKKRFPDIKIGGYSSWGFPAITEKNSTESDKHQYVLKFFLDFVKYVSEHSSPIDFFSWHSYYPVKTTVIWEEFVRTTLEKHGLGHIENHLTEWCPFPDQYGTAKQSAEIAAMMIAMQNRSPSILCIYDMRSKAGLYCPFFDLKVKPIQGYYSMVAFNQLYKLGNQTELSVDTEELYALCATDGRKCALLIVNLTGETQALAIEGVDLADARVSVIDDNRLLSWAPDANTIENNVVILVEWRIQ